MMGAWAGCLLILCGQALSPAEKSLIDAVWTALQTHENYVRQHRGYLAFLDSHADIASAEEAWNALVCQGALRGAADTFEESLLTNETARRAWDHYTETLARDDALRVAEDSWYRVVLGPEAIGAHGCAGVFWLQANAGDAIRFLENPARLVPLPGPLNPLQTWFAAHPRTRDEWRNAFQKLYACAAAHHSVFPWWKMCPPEYQQFFARLARHPADFWTWRRHALAWAAEPRARDWARYWRGCVRRDSTLSDRYAAYVLFLRERPAWQSAADRVWEKDFGPVPAWPPSSEPPGLEPAASAAPPVFPRKESDFIPPRRPGKPGITMPDMPEKPEKPKLKESAAPRFKRGEVETPRQAVPQ